jgi:E3 ubiquitin-protein ligase UBR1
VEVILKNRLRKKTGVKDPVIVPKPFTITSGPFSIFPSVLESEALLQVMFYTIFNVIALTNSAGTASPSAEAILDQTF